MRNLGKKLLKLIVLGLLLVKSQWSARAASKTWDGGGADAKWSTINNWNPDALPADNNDIIFANTSVFTSGTTIDLNGNRTLDDLTIASTTSFTIANNTLQIDGGNVNRTATGGNHVINSAVTMAANTTWNVAAGGDLTVGGAIGQSGGNRNLVKSGTGTLILTGNNSYAGTTTISAGTLIAGSNNALGTTTGGTTVASGATLGFQGGITYSTAEAVTSVQGTGASSVGAINNVSGDNTFAGAVTMANTTSFGSASGTLTFNGVIAGSFALTKVGSGTVAFSNSGNTFTGAININAGTLSVGADSYLGNSANDIVFGSGGTGTLQASSTMTLGGGRTISLNSGAGTIDVSSGTLTLGTAGQIIGTGGNSLTKTGGGTLLISASNAGSFTSGTTIINGGTIQISAEDNLGAAGNDVTLNGGTLNVTSGFTASSSKLFTIGGSGGTLDINPSQTLTIGSGQLASGVSTTLTKAGTGTLVLTGNNSSYTGNFVVNAGTLQVSAENNLGAAANDITLNNGTLSVTSGFTFDSNKTLSVLAGGGTLDIASSQTLTLSSGSQLLGAGNLTKQGLGSLVLSGDNSSTFTGNTIINAGTVQISAENNLGASANDVTINGGTLDVTSGFNSLYKTFTIGGSGGILNVGSGTLTLGSAGQLDGSGNLTKTGAGILALSGDNSSFTGNTIINGGTVQVSAQNNLGAAGNDITLDSGTLAVTSGFTTDTGKIFTFNSGGGTLDVSSGTLTLGSASQITGTGNLTKSGAGTLTVGGSSGYTGNLVINGGEVRVEGNKTAVDGFLTSSRLQAMTGSGGTLTVAYNDATQKDRIISSQPTVPSSIKLGFDSVTRTDHSYGLGAVANDMQNYAGLVIKGGQVYVQVDQTFLGNGSTPTTLDVTGGEFQLFGGSGPATVTFNGKVTLSGGTVNGGGFGGAKGTLATSGDVEVNSGVTITGLPNITMQPTIGVTTRFYGTASGVTLYNFIKDGPGTVQIDSTFGTANLVDVKAGTLLLGAANRITDDSALRLSGGTFGTGGFNETLSTLTLSSTSYIDLGASGSSILHFADTSSMPWTGGSSLVVYNWSGNLLMNGTGTDQLYFGSTSSGLTASQLSQIWFVDPAGFASGAYPADITAAGEVIPRPVPEPGTVAGICLLFAALGYRERKSLASVIIRLRRR